MSTIMVIKVDKKMYFIWELNIPLWKNLFTYHQVLIIGLFPLHNIIYLISLHFTEFIGSTIVNFNTAN